MYRYKLSSILLLSMILTTACNVFTGGGLQAARERELARLDQERASLSPLLDELVQRSNSIQVQGRALTPGEMELVDAIGALREAVATTDRAVADLRTQASDRKAVRSLSRYSYTPFLEEAKALARR